VFRNNEENGVRTAVVTKGGPGSGFHGHAGIEGHQGGSSHDFSSEKRVPQMKSPGYVQIYHGTSAEYVKSIARDGIKKMSGNALGYGNNRPDSVYFTADRDSAMAYGEGKASEHLGNFAVVEFVVPKEYEKDVIFDTEDFEYFGQEHNYRLEQDISTKWISGITIYSSDSKRIGYIPFIDGEAIFRNMPDLDKYVTQKQTQKKYYVVAITNVKKKITVTKGGPGSGFRGHAGRPGKVGGSASGNSWSQTELTGLEDTLHKFVEMTAVSPLSRDLLKHGEFFRPPTHNSMPEGINRGEMKQCYSNAALYANDDKGWYYTEGYAISDSLQIPIEHAWITTKDGQVIDPTWKTDFGGMAYYGIRMKSEFVWDTLARTRYYGIYSNDYLDKHRLYKNGISETALVKD
jgi:hypothetical protein